MDSGGTRKMSRLSFTACPAWALASDHAFTVTAPSATASATVALGARRRLGGFAGASFLAASGGRTLVAPLRGGRACEEGDRRFRCIRASQGRAVPCLHQSYQTSG